MNPVNTQAIKIALITGASRRIGAAIARQLHQNGYQVIVHCHQSLKDANDLVDELNQKRTNSARVIAQDLCAEHAAESLIKASLDWAGHLDVLIHNASVFYRSPLDVFDNKDWDKLFDTNVKAPYQLSLAAQKALKASKGSIIYITDIHAEAPLKDYAIYCQTKAALTMQMKALAKAFAPHIRVNAVAPGAIAWPEEDNSLSPQQKQQIMDKTPLKKHGSPEHIAQAVMALLENEFIEGQTLRVDGGRSMT